MKETFSIWKSIFTAPVVGYERITPQTKVLLPLLLLVLVLVAAGLLKVPVVTSEAYQTAYLRANLNFMDRSSLFNDPAVRQAAADQLSSPLTRGLTVARTLAGPAFNLLIALPVAAAVLWLIGLLAGNKLKFGLVLRVFLFTWAVFAWQELVTGVILLLSDRQALFGGVNTMVGFRIAQAVPFSLALLFPPGSVSLPVFFAVDFVTNIFNIIFYYLLYRGLRHRGEKSAAWRAGVMMGVIALLHFAAVVGPAFYS